MKLIRYIYKTKTLSEYGRFIFITILVLLLAGNIFIPEYQPQNIDNQLLRLKGKHFKFADSPHVKDFIRSVKTNDGFICIGTSESTPLRDGNYYEFLDRDTSYPNRFSILGGAGWTCGLHMAMLLNNKEEVSGLNIIYFINPVYWRSELNGFNKGYWTRYLNYGAYKKTLRSSDEAAFKDISKNYGEVLNFGERLLFTAEYWLREVRKPFFQDLRYFLQPNKYYEDLAFRAKPKTEYEDFEYFGIIDTSYIDTSWNITHEFKSRTWLNPITDNDHRYRELIAFNKLSRDLGVNVTYILGPINDIYIRKYHPPYLDGYLQTIDKIRETLMSEKADFIDATDLGNIPGSFIDNQHHSSYGAYLIYKKTKKHLYEKKDL